MQMYVLILNTMDFFQIRRYIVLNLINVVPWSMNIEYVYVLYVYVLNTSGVT